MSRRTCRTSDYFLPCPQEHFPVKKAIPLIHGRTAMYDIADKLSNVEELYEYAAHRADS